MNEITCPLCGREMTAIETYPGRGELYCVYCDLTIGGNEAKTPDELMALLGQRTCQIETTEGWIPAERYHRCKHCEAFFAVLDASGDTPPRACPNCGRRIVKEGSE